mmetsp:Transcript_15979/g.45862  ORF Transcript_15979/g.45862 Transcript_15979/m.45862 type:complete len:88 (-) Transcript_15979:655-918(-)
MNREQQYDTRHRPPPCPLPCLFFEAAKFKHNEACVRSQFHSGLPLTMFGVSSSKLVGRVSTSLARRSLASATSSPLVIPVELISDTL